MYEESNIWYHGSPILFDEFKLGMPTNSRIGHDDSLFFTREYKFAKAFSKNKHIYTVEITDAEENFEFEIADLNSIVNEPSNGLINPITLEGKAERKGIPCIRIFDPKLVKIIKIETMNKLSYTEWVKKYWDKDDDHNYWTSIYQRVEDGIAPGDLSRYSKDDLKEEYQKYLNDTSDRRHCNKNKN